MSHQAEISYLTLSEALQDVFVRQRTGILTVVGEGGREKFVVLGGQLYLSGTNPCREDLDRVLAGPPAGGDDPRFDPRSYLNRELRKLVRKLSKALAARKVGDLRFAGQLADVPDDVIGPVPTAPLVMDLATHGLTAEELLRRLGGAAAKYRTAADDRMRLRVPDVDVDDMVLLDRLEKSATVGSLIANDEEPAEVLRRLVRLDSVGLVEAVSEPSRAAAGLSREVLGRIADRVREDLESHPLEIDPKAHRARVDRLLEDYGRLGYYDLLEVEADASAEDVHAAFMKMAREAHPVHAEALGLSSGRKLEWLLSRLTEAYLVLSDPERSAEYRRGAGTVPVPRQAIPDSDERSSERVALARESYLVALDRIEREDYFYAIEMLRHAIRNDERAEYYALLGSCQMENKQWLHLAVDSFRRAVQLSPEDEELRHLLAEAREEYRIYEEELESRRGKLSEDERQKTRTRRVLAKLRRQRR